MIYVVLCDVHVTLFYSSEVLYPEILCCPTGLLQTKNVFWTKIWFELLIFFHDEPPIPVNDDQNFNKCVNFFRLINLSLY